MDVYGLHMEFKRFSWFLIPCHVLMANKMLPLPLHTLGQGQIKESMTLYPASRNGYRTQAWPPGTLHRLGQRFRDELKWGISRMTQEHNGAVSTGCAKFSEWKPWSCWCSDVGILLQDRETVGSRDIIVIPGFHFAYTPCLDMVLVIWANNIPHLFTFRLNLFEMSFNLLQLKTCCFIRIVIFLVPFVPLCRDWLSPQRNPWLQMNSL